MYFSNEPIIDIFKSIKFNIISKSTFTDELKKLNKNLIIFFPVINFL